MGFRKELEQLINRHSQENGSNTPDFILARFLCHSLCAFDDAVNRREQWDGRVGGWREKTRQHEMDWRPPAPCDDAEFGMKP
jgi:hypothetical protein